VWQAPHHWLNLCCCPLGAAGMHGVHTDHHPRLLVCQVSTMQSPVRPRAGWAESSRRSSQPHSSGGNESKVPGKERGWHPNHPLTAQ
jgi:hypothetical protein